MKHALLAALLALVVLLAGARAGADAVPPGQRGVEYTLTIENLADYPDHAFFVYPTTNNGYAYRLSPGKSLNGLLARAGWAGPGSSLHAIPRAELQRRIPQPKELPHGDRGEMVQIFPPPRGALVASADITPPELVPTDSPLRRIERVYRIARLTADTFELALVENTGVKKDGSRAPVPLSAASATPSAEPAPSASPASPPPAPGPPARTAGCGGGCAMPPAGPAAAAWAPALALALLRLRRGRRPR